jgi:hypothetical protein
MDLEAVKKKEKKSQAWIDMVELQIWLLFWESNRHAK